LLAFPKIARTRRPRRVPGGLVLRSHAGLARLAVASALAGLALDAAAGTRVAAVDLSDLSLEQLGNVIVSSVSRRLQPVAAAPASVFVIQRDDIRRSGATSLAGGAEARAQPPGSACRREPVRGDRARLELGPLPTNCL
jgi:outer membrane receptor protein involved in Fe transport